MSQREDGRRRGMMRPLALSSIAVAAAFLVGPARGTEPTPAPGVDNSLKLRGLEDSIDLSAARRKQMQGEIDAAREDAGKLRSALIETTARVSADETQVAASQAHLDRALLSEGAVKRSLDGRRAVIAEVLAALQRMGRKPPPALLVDPDDVLKAIRTSMLLGAVLPGMRADVDALVADLRELARARAGIEAERRNLADDLARLGAERVRLAALIEARQAALGSAEAALAAERERAQALAGQATSLKELIGRMEAESRPAAEAAEAARRSDQKTADQGGGDRKKPDGQVAALLPPDAAVRPGGVPRDPARLAPAVAFASLKGALSLPAAGSPLRSFGSPDGFGGTEKGVRFQTGIGAVVASPSDGWIAYAGPYRSFGQLLIVNAGNGYYIVLAGMERINVDLGQFVLAGEPVAVMGDGSAKTAAAMALGAAQPILYVEFRKDGATIDPGPWWAKPELQKVRG